MHVIKTQTHQLSLSIYFPYQSTFLINQLSLPIYFPHESNFIVSLLSLSINFPHQLTFLIKWHSSSTFLINQHSLSFNFPHQLTFPINFPHQSTFLVNLLPTFYVFSSTYCVFTFKEIEFYYKCFFLDLCFLVGCNISSSWCRRDSLDWRNILCICVNNCNIILIVFDSLVQTKGKRYYWVRWNK